MERDPLNPKDQLAQREHKVRLDLLDLDALEGVARVMEFGAIEKGYGVRNYATIPIAERVYIAATLRHLSAILRGEDKAPDSGLYHWDHIGANAMIVQKARLAGTLVDDRGPHGPQPVDRERYLAPTRESARSNDQIVVPVEGSFRRAMDAELSGGDPHESNWKAMD
jgi:hypothetical protein